MYEVRRPIQDGPERWQSAMTVSRHRTLTGAYRSLVRQQEGAQQHGGYSQDRICERDEDGWHPVDIDGDREETELYETREQAPWNHNGTQEIVENWPTWER